MHGCVCLLFPSLCLRMWSFGSCKRRSSRSATMDRFPAIFLSSLNLMTANTASHGFELNLLRATWSQVSFPFTLASACRHLGLTSSSLTAWLSLCCLYISDSSLCPISPLWLFGFGFWSQSIFHWEALCYNAPSLSFQMRQWTFPLMYTSAKTL